MLRNCQKCGAPVNAGMFKCPNCGANLVYQQQEVSEHQEQFTNQSMYGQSMPGQQMYRQPMPTQNVFGVSSQQSVDNGSIGWFILGFFIPLVGFIIYFVCSGSNPGKAKKAGLGGLIGFCNNVILTIIFSKYMGL